LAYLSCNGLAVLKGTLTLPLVGPWAADLVIDSATIPDGFVTLALGWDASVKLVGTITRGGPVRGATTARVVGGAGGLGTVLPAKGYHGVTLRLPLSEALSAGGERLSEKSDRIVLSTYLQAWSRFASPVGIAVAALMHAVPGASWRMVNDGSVWVGNETWLPSRVAKYVVTKEDPHHARQEIAAEVPAIYPGETLNGRRVSCVEHRVEPRQARATVWFDE
jgi:hypothetical protein